MTYSNHFGATAEIRDLSWCAFTLNKNRHHILIATAYAASHPIVTRGRPSSALVFGKQRTSRIAKGYSTKEISAKLFISENTVETHRQKLLAKLKASNMAQLIIKAIAAGYINPLEISAETER